MSFDCLTKKLYRMIKNTLLLLLMPIKYFLKIKTDKELFFNFISARIYFYPMSKCLMMAKLTQIIIIHYPIPCHI